MKILILIPFVPYPINSGGNQAFFAMTDYLKELHEISVIPYVSRWERSNYDKLVELWGDSVRFYPYFDKNTVPDESPEPIYLRILNYINGSSGRKINRYYAKNILHFLNTPNGQKKYSSLYYKPPVYPEEFFRHIYDTTHNNRFDIIQIEFYNSLLFDHIFPDNVKTVYVQHEIQSVRWKNEMELFDSVSWNDHITYTRKCREEIYTMQSFDHIITLTEHDKKKLSEYIPESRIHVSPAIFNKFDMKMTFSQCHSDFVFVGGHSHFPNLDAINWFCTKILPILRARKFNFTLYVVGVWHKRLVNELKKKYPELIFKGFVEDLAAFINGKISLVPIRIGSGMRIKILDAVNAMSPFITTAKGVEGLDFRNGEECIIAETAETFADSMIMLSSDMDKQRLIAKNALDMIYSKYNPARLFRQRAEIYDTIQKQ